MQVTKQPKAVIPVSTDARNHFRGFWEWKGTKVQRRNPNWNPKKTLSQTSSTIIELIMRIYKEIKEELIV